jgi:GrpB-like predicted nucleotidyltransferase (UPF0157 family)
VHVFRFDEEVSIPILDFGSRFRVAPLTAGSANVRVQVMHLPPDGRVGRHAAAHRQLFGVVSGSGWVSGEDGGHREIDAGFAALWEEGEEHEAGSRHGLSAVCIEGDFDMWAFRVTAEIVVVDSDPEWPEWFERLHSYVWPAVADIAIRIDHVGSTSVPDLAAKPIIDMDVVVASSDDVRPIIERLKTIGYRWRGDLGVVGREAFALDRETPLPPHHLYLVVENNRAHVDHWLLRDFLRDDAEARQRYGTLKKRNVDLARGDMDVYVAAKAELVAELLRRARADGGLSPETYWEPPKGRGGA